MIGIFIVSNTTSIKMARTRALMTKAEREQIANKDDTDENRRYQAISRVRSRIQEELPRDVEILREHHPELFEELCDVVRNELPE